MSVRMHVYGRAEQAVRGVLHTHFYYTTGTDSRSGLARRRRDGRAMAPDARSAHATSMSRLLFGVFYFAALVGWNWVCRQHYAQVTEPVIRRSSASNRIVPGRPAKATTIVGGIADVDNFPTATKLAAATTAHATSGGVGATRAAASTTASRASTSAAGGLASAGDGAATAQCGPGRKPYHTLLTTQATVYQQWQSRIMYYHWQKQKTRDGPCTEMGGFTRLVASEGGKPDGLEGEMPSAFVVQYTAAEIHRYGDFGVLNRPYSVVQWIERGGMAALAEAYVYIAETDHVLMRPLPNLATEEKAAAFSFGYMHCGPGHQSIIDKFVPGTSYRDVQPVGPSPLIIHRPALARLASKWLNVSLALKLDRTADSRFGWVLEMWGYSLTAASYARRHRHDACLPRTTIYGTHPARRPRPKPHGLRNPYSGLHTSTLWLFRWRLALAPLTCLRHACAPPLRLRCAPVIPPLHPIPLRNAAVCMRPRLGIRHEVLPTFQVEGGAGISADRARERGAYIFHYTYGIEYTMGGRPQGVNQIGEWSLDKRHCVPSRRRSPCMHAHEHTRLLSVRTLLCAPVSFLPPCAPTDGGAYPPRHMQPPPSGASDGAKWLLEAWNEASAGIAAWPTTRALGTVGWRRNKGDGISGSELAQKVMGSKWSWAGIAGLGFEPHGSLKTPWGVGAWGALPTGGGVDYTDEGFCAPGCLFADFGGGLHNLKFDFTRTPWTFKSYRLGDGTNVDGVMHN